jgi:hypothetical protein
MKEIEITIDQEGEVSIDVRGMKGKGCEKLAAALEKALGETKKKVLKPEFFEQEKTSEHLSIHD